MDIDNLTKSELLIMCKELGFVNYTTKSKEDLTQLIYDIRNNKNLHYLNRKKLVSKCFSVGIILKCKSFTKDELINLINIQLSKG